MSKSITTSVVEKQFLKFFSFTYLNQTFCLELPGKCKGKDCGKKSKL